jgi:hypothetical protein
MGDSDGDSGWPALEVLIKGESEWELAKEEPRPGGCGGIVPDIKGLERIKNENNKSRNEEDPERRQVGWMGDQGGVDTDWNCTMQHPVVRCGRLRWRCRKRSTMSMGYGGP